MQASSEITRPQLWEVSQHLRCPDDRSPLLLHAESFQCSSCERVFPIHGGRIIEILPSEPAVLPKGTSERYRRAYVREFHRAFEWNPTATAWKAPEKASAVFVRRLTRQVELLRLLLGNSRQHSNSLLCDASGKAGYYTLAYAASFHTVLHCDLSVDALNYMFFKTQRSGPHNIILIRADPANLPFMHTIPTLLCVDTLIVGEEHDMRVLRSIRRSMAPGAIGLVDFHNWWHNPLARLGLLPDNFGSNRSYTRGESELFLRGLGFSYEFFPFHQELNVDSPAARVVSKVLPATRLVYRISRDNAAIGTPAETPSTIS